MSAENFTSAAPAEEAFAALEQHLQRLKSAVSHLTLSEAAATKAIEAAERVLQEQQLVSQQVTGYVAQLPRLLSNEELLRQLQELSTQVTQQTHQLEQLLAAAPTLELLTTLQTVQAEQRDLLTAVQTVEQTVRQGVAHYPSKQLAGFLHDLLEPLRPDPQLTDLQLRQQHLLPELQRQLTQLAGTQASSQLELNKRLRELANGLQPGLEQVLHQVNAGASALGVLRKRLETSSQPEINLAGNLADLQTQLTALQRTAAAQQHLQQRASKVQVVTLLVVLAALVLSAVQLLRG